MLIDLPTLMTAGSFVAAVSGVFLIFAAMQTKGAQGMIWWAAADLTMAAAVPMLLSSGVAINLASVVVAITLLNVSPALILASAQACNGRRPDLRVIFAGAVLWLAAYALPAIRTSPEAQVSLNLAIASVYVFAAAAEFWHGRVDRLDRARPLDPPARPARHLRHRRRHCRRRRRPVADQRHDVVDLAGLRAFRNVRLRHRHVDLHRRHDPRTSGIAPQDHRQHRLADRACHPPRLLRGGRESARGSVAAPPRRSASSCSISMPSRRSTTPTATDPATRC